MCVYGVVCFVSKHPSMAGHFSLPSMRLVLGQQEGPVFNPCVIVLIFCPYWSLRSWIDVRSPEQAASTLNSFSVLSENAGSVRVWGLWVEYCMGISRCFLGYQNYGQVYDWIRKSTVTESWKSGFNDYDASTSSTSSKIKAALQTLESSINPLLCMALSCQVISPVSIWDILRLEDHTK